MDAADQERAKRISSRVCELEKLMNKAQELDLVFLVDVTNNMQVYLDMVKHKVVDIANGVRRVHKQLALRVAFAPYRDYAYRTYDDAETCDSTNSFKGGGSTFIKALTGVQTEKMIYTAQPGSRPWIEEEQLSSNVDNLMHIVVTNAGSTISHTISVSVPG